MEVWSRHHTHGVVVAEVGIQIQGIRGMAIRQEAAAGTRTGQAPEAGMHRFVGAWRQGSSHHTQAAWNLKNDRTFQGGAEVAIVAASTIDYMACLAEKRET